MVIEEEREKSRRQQLLDHWDIELERVTAQKGEEGTNLQFGEGGVYSLDDLRTRSAMLRTFIGTLRRVHEDIEGRDCPSIWKL
jgi:hypothetical protein